MFKSLRESIRSFWSSEKVQLGSKRKRDTSECVEEDDPDVQIVRVEKKRRLDDHSLRIAGLFRNPMSKMADWLKPKRSAFSEDFQTRPKIKSTMQYGNIDSSVQENGCHSNVHLRPIPQINGESSETHRRGPSYNETYSDNVGTAPTNMTLQHRPSGSSIFGSKRSMAGQSIRLKEKACYSDLIQSMASSYQPKTAFNQVRSRTSSTSSETSKASQGLSYIPRDGSIERFFIPKVAELVKNSSIPDLVKLQREQYEKLMPPPPASTMSRPDLAGHVRGEPAPLLSPRSLMVRKSAVCSRRDLSHSRGLSGTKAAAPVIIEDEDVIIVNGKDDGCHIRRVQSSTRVSPPADTIVVGDDEDEVRGQVSRQQQKRLDMERAHQESILQSYFQRNQARARVRERRKQEIKEQEMTAKAYEKKRQVQTYKLEKEMKCKMRIFDKVPEVVEELRVSSSDEEEEESLPELTDEMMDVVRRALRPGNPNEVLSEAFRLQITRRDMSTLGGLNWLNDEVINFYMNMLMERGEQEGKAKVYAFNTFFYPKIMSGGHQAVRRWTKKVDIFSVHFIIIPVHLGVHWCLCMVDMQDKKITYYDSMGARNDKCLHAVLNYINDESVAKKQTPINKSEWSLINADDNPQQMNGSDCGMFMCKYAEYISRQQEITFTQEDMPYFRQRMVYEIVSKKLLQ